jgi:hypothetical protein
MARIYTTGFNDNTCEKCFVPQASERFPRGRRKMKRSSKE